MTLRDWLALLAMALAVMAASLTPQVHQGREGLVTHMGAGYPAEYLAVPLGPGVRVTICGPRTCLTLTSTDAGPNRASLRAGRIADVSIPLFRRLCGCSETRGYFRGSWRVGGPAPTPPQTDTAP